MALSRAHWMFVCSIKEYKIGYIGVTILFNVVHSFTMMIDLGEATSCNQCIFEVCCMNLLTACLIKVAGVVTCSV